MLATVARDGLTTLPPGCGVSGWEGQRVRFAQAFAQSRFLLYEPADPIAYEFAKRLRAAGCSIAVGADGPDGITFRPAKDFAADFMKIGGHLIRAVMSDSGAAARLRAFNVACRTFGIQTVAQHVEDRATLGMLSALGFDYAQGYEISRPAPLLDPHMTPVLRAARPPTLTSLAAAPPNRSRHSSGAQCAVAYRTRPGG